MITTTINLEALSQLFADEGFSYVRERDYRADKVVIDGRLEYPIRYHSVPEIMAMVEGVEEADWAAIVDDDLKARRAAAIRAKRLLSYEAVEDAAIRAFLIEGAAEPRRHEARPCNLSGLGKLAMREREHVPAYQPLPGGMAKLRLKEAVSFEHRQEAYADHTVYAIPVTIADGADLEVCKKNLWRFSGAVRTANGLAGHGSTWDFTLVERAEGFFVLADCRSSIAD